MSTILSIEDYTLDYVTGATFLRALDRVSLTIAPGEMLGLAGESGSGKSTLASAIMRFLPANARERCGTIRLAGEDLRTFDHGRLRRLRGSKIAMVFQDPATALNPTLPLGRQLSEVFEYHLGLTRTAARAEAMAALRRVEIADPEAIFVRYPHQVSGGEKQRVVIATALACRPELVLLDEPTTALDVLTGARILDLLRRLRREFGMAGLYISHDLALLARITDRVAVIHRGRIVEVQPSATIFRNPGQAYTRRLAAAVPRPDRRLVADEPSAAELLRLEALSVRYGRAGLFRGSVKLAADAVSFTIREGEILGLIGESGSGKSSLARAMAGIVPYAGTLRFAGRPIRRPAEMDPTYRRAVQIVFQNPDSSLNPRQRVRDLLARPLRLFGFAPSEVSHLLEEVQLPAAHARRFPHQLSGGEKQRVAIARAFAARPRLLICDEITASLDVSVQSRVIELLLALRAAHGTAYLFITHDLNLLRQIAHRVAVMYRGRLVDLQASDRLSATSAHTYTRELIAASPSPLTE